MEMWMQAGAWGLLAGSALLIGAIVGYFFNLSQRSVAAFMAFGAGVLISALAFDLMDTAWERGGLLATSAGFFAGAAGFTFINWLLAAAGARHRKRSGDHMRADDGGGLAIAVGSLLDGIPESIVIGLSLIEGSTVSFVAVVAIFLSNLPEGLSSAAGLRKAGRGPLYIFGLWLVITVACAGASIAGYTLFTDYGDAVVAATLAVAAGAVLAMLVDTMIPEAYNVAHDFAGLVTVSGFLVAFVLSKMTEGG